MAQLYRFLSTAAMDASNECSPTAPIKASCIYLSIYINLTVQPAVKGRVNGYQLATVCQVKEKKKVIRTHIHFVIATVLRISRSSFTVRRAQGLQSSLSESKQTTDVRYEPDLRSNDRFARHEMLVSY